MANRKISDLTALTSTATGDLLPIVDISEAAAADQNKKITIENLFQGIPVNVGIGTSSVGAQLEVLRTSTTDPSLRLRYNSASYYGDHLMDGNGNYIIYSPTANGVSSGNLKLRAGGNFSVSTNDQAATNPALTIDTSQRVGIGTTSPVDALSVRAGTDANFHVRPLSGLGLGTGIFIDSTIDGAAAVTALGFRANQYLFRSSAGEFARIDTSGRLLVGTSIDSGGALFQVNGDRVRIGTAKTPASATATGATGEICWDASYIYVCTATNTWKRTAIATW